MKTFVVLSIIVHFCLFLSITDIYFTTRIVSGIGKFKYNHTHPIPTKRILLIVADDLRVDIFEEMKPNVETLSARLEKGMWGVMEARPSMVGSSMLTSLLAGVCESPLNFRLFSGNLMHFDSLLNTANGVFAILEQSVLKRFFPYDKKEWVFNKPWTEKEYEKDFMGCAINEKLAEMLYGTKRITSLYKTLSNLDGVLCVLHFPQTYDDEEEDNEEYASGLKHLDEHIGMIEKLLRAYFNKEEVTVIVTSGTGKSKDDGRGTVLVPLIAWGPGIPKVNFSGDVEPVDLTVLISTLLHVSIPDNSEGMLQHILLNASQPFIAESYYVNLKQMTNKYLVEMGNVKNKTFLFKGFPEMNRSTLSLTLDNVEKGLQEGNYQFCVRTCRDTMRRLKLGLKYLYTYNQSSLLSVNTLTYVGWIIFCLLYISPTEIQFSHKQYFFLVFSLSITYVFLWLSLSSIRYYIYYTLPQILWSFDLCQIYKIRNNIKSYVPVYDIITYGSGVLLLAATFKSRVFLALLLVCIFHRPFLIRIKEKTNFWQLTTWSLTSLLMGAFLLSPPLYTNKTYTLISSGVILIIMSSKSASTNSRKIFNHSFVSIIRISFLISAISLTLIVNYCDFVALVSYISFCLLLASLLLPVLDRSKIINRSFNTLLSFGVALYMLSSGIETFFYAIFILHLFVLVRFENDVGLGFIQPISEVSLNDFQTAFFFLIYIFMSFFCINDQTAFVDLKSNFLLFPNLNAAILSFIKYFIPFAATINIFQLLFSLKKQNEYRVYIILHIYCDIIGYFLLFQIKTEGSNLDINASVASYVVIQMIFYLLLLSNKLLKCYYGQKKVSCLHEFHDYSKSLEECHQPK